MAVKKKKDLKQQTLEHNNLLRLLSQENPPPYREIAKNNNLTVSGVNVMARRLKLAGRLNERREVVDKTLLTVGEFSKLPYPYPLDRAKKKIAGKKTVKKAAKKKNGAAPEPVLPEPMTFEQPQAAGLTITISPEALVAIVPVAVKTFFTMLREGRIK